ncbi:hypothetical protein MOD25_04995 [Bacillus haynesii]|uniref:hypothetical protein n=1 Tax=Bacillus haynesii TaxID=1925021 RepID=UPI002282724A|nr:hypothetical protein [Bacillus haynesii]MCY8549262.1 hypothetical protein [Bacillus haynesii]
MTQEIKEFHEWREDKGFTPDEVQFLSEVTACLSAIKYNNVLPEEKIKLIVSRYREDFPKAEIPDDIGKLKNLTFDDYAEIVQRGVSREFSVEELLYSFFKQGLCAQLAFDLLKTEDSSKAKEFVRKMEK